MLRTRIIALLTLLAALPSAASITGVVMTREGAPVAGAKVFTFALEGAEATRARWVSGAVERKPLTTATTDSKGAFALESPKDAVAELRIEASGYAPEYFRVEKDEEVGAIPLIAAPNKQGSVTANGKPVAGATVIFLMQGAEAVAKTDDAGRYVAPDPAAWAVRVVAIHPDFAIYDQFNQAGPFATSKLDLSIKLDAGVAVSGSVRGRTGDTGVAGASIIVDGWPLAKSGDDGTFTVPHAPKKWEMLEARSGDLAAARSRNAKGEAVLRLVPAASVMGTVRDARNQQPVAFAEVRVAQNAFGGRQGAGPAAATFTDAKGNYALRGFAPGTYSVSAVRPGYTFSSVPASVASGQTVQKALVATPDSRITGVVLDEEKKPVVMARLSAQSNTRPDMMMINIMRMTSGREFVSGPDGRFTVRTSSEGDLQVHALKRGFPTGRSSTLAVKAGDRKSNVVITVPRGIEVTGRIVDKDDNPISGVSVTAAEADASPMAGMRRIVQMGRMQRPGTDDNVRTGSDGTFSIRLKEGSWDFGFTREGYAPKAVRGVQVSATAPAKPVEAKMEAGVEIQGRVVRNGMGIDGAMVGAFSLENQVTTTTGPDGSFTLSDLAPGPMMVNVNKQEEFITLMRNITAPARDVLIEIPPGGRITGRVVDKNTRQPIRQFQAGLERSRSGGGMVMVMPPQLQSFTSDDGSFVLENVPVGQIQVVADAPGYTTGRVMNLTVEEGKTLSDIEVVLDPGVKLSGRVTGPDGSPLAAVNIRPSMDGPVMRFNPGENVVTDANGEYSFDALEAGERTFTFGKAGYVATSKTVQLSGKETRLDVQLSSGMKLTGTVVTEAGAPVGEADVRASSAAAGSGGRSTRTDPNGNFTMEGLAPGRYTFTASKASLAEGVLRDFDISGGAQPRVIMPAGGTIYGRVTGLSESELANVVVNVRGTTSGTQVAVDGAGTFKLDGAPVGTVRVSANLGRGFGEGRSSGTKTIEVSSGSSVEVNLDFASGATVRGRVTRDGKPLVNANVSFFTRAAAPNSNATTDASGNYTVSGLGEAKYTVAVTEMQSFTRYTTSYDVRGSGSFDIDVRTSTIRGRVLESGSGSPIKEARVQVRKSATSIDEGPMMNNSGITDPEGNFVIEGVSGGNYTVSADKTGYGNATREIIVTDSSAPQDLELRIAKNDGVVVKILDARDKRQLSGDVIVYDAQNRPMNDNMFRFEPSSADGVKLSLAPGSYRATVSAYGYAPRNVTLTSPSNQVVELTPGGQLQVTMKGSSGLMRMRILEASGLPYGRFLDAAGSMPFSTSATIQNIAAGQYKVQILGEGSAVTAERVVVVVDGQMAKVEF